MINSRDLKLLREDVRVNVEKLISICKEQGLPILITQTLRDDEYQATLYAQGRTKPGVKITNSKVTTFHGFGLAVDFCKNVKGHEFDDDSFFLNVAIIAKAMGFTWGGDWKSFPDKPHLQWDDHGKVSGTALRNGIAPSKMEEYMTYSEWKKYMEQYRNELSKKKVSSWAKEIWEKLTKKNITDGSRPGDLITREEVAIILDRMNKEN